MDPILRRSSFTYLTTLLTYCALLGRFLVTRDWTAFEIIPLFMPVWLASAMLFSERDESYAFLRALPVADAVVVRTKFRLILTFATIQWLLMTMAALFRTDDGAAGASVLVYVALICAAALLVVACLQIGIWRYGLSVMTAVIMVFILVGLALVIVHMASLKYESHWPALSRLAVVEWLGGAPWLSIAAIAAVALVAFFGLMRAGLRVKASSEAYL